MAELTETPAPTGTPAPRCGLVGAGALGSALALRLAAVGCPVAVVVSRDAAAARALAARVGAAVASDRVADLPEGLDAVFLCVPDRAVAAVAAALAATGRRWDGTVVAHTSGALPAAELAPLAPQGAALLSFHPVQTFPPGADPARFEGIGVGLEGDAAALDFGRRLALRLGARPLVLPPEAKARYHLAAALASNFFVTLCAIAGEVLHSIGLDAADAQALLQPLLETTLQNVGQRPPGQALTGPIVRGDAAVVAMHLGALAAHLPHLLPVYRALAAETVRLAVEAGRLDPAAAATLVRRLEDAGTGTDS